MPRPHVARPPSGARRKPTGGKCKDWLGRPVRCPPKKKAVKKK